MRVLRSVSVGCLMLPRAVIDARTHWPKPLLLQCMRNRKGHRHNPRCVAPQGGMCVALLYSECDAPVKPLLHYLFVLWGLEDIGSISERRDQID